MKFYSVSWFPSSTTVLDTKKDVCLCAVHEACYYCSYPWRDKNKNHGPMMWNVFHDFPNWYHLRNASQGFNDSPDDSFIEDGEWYCLNDSVHSMQQNCSFLMYRFWLGFTTHFRMKGMDSWLQNKLLSGKHGESTIFAMRCSPRPLRSITRVVEKCAKMLPEAWARPQGTKLSCDWHGWSTSRTPWRLSHFHLIQVGGWRSSRPPTGLG